LFAHVSQAPIRFFKPGDLEFAIPIQNNLVNLSDLAIGSTGA
jgi:hypothetical protein